LSAIETFYKLNALETDTNNIASNLLFIADCHYLLGDYSKAIKLATDACSIAKGNGKLSICEMAKYWLEDYQQLIDNPRSIKKRHIYFEQ
jgi:hypothetical protein